MSRSGKHSAAVLAAVREKRLQRRPESFGIAVIALAEDIQRLFQQQSYGAKARYGYTIETLGEGQRIMRAFKDLKCCLKSAYNTQHRLAIVGHLATAMRLEPVESPATGIVRWQLEVELRFSTKAMFKTT